MLRWHTFFRLFSNDGWWMERTIVRKRCLFISCASCIMLHNSDRYCMTMQSAFFQALFIQYSPLLYKKILRNTLFCSSKCQAKGVNFLDFSVGRVWWNPSKCLQKTAFMCSTSKLRWLSIASGFFALFFHDFNQGRERNTKRENDYDSCNNDNEMYFDRMILYYYKKDDPNKKGCNNMLATASAKRRIYITFHVGWWSRTIIKGLMRGDLCFVVVCM